MQTQTFSRDGHYGPLNAGFTLVEIMTVVAMVGLLASIALPNFIRARKSSNVSACINNLRVIDIAVQELKLERIGAKVSEDNIRLFIGFGSNGSMPHCPAGGTYGDFDTSVSCSSQEPGFEHSLPD